MLPDLVSLALFTRVAEMRSITRAAEASHMALAAASRRISMLEHQYGVRLLERTARGTELTSAGRAALYHARQVLSQVDRLRDELQEYAKGRKGHIRLLASASATSQFLPDDLASFSADAPDVAMTFEEKSSGEIAQALSLPGASRAVGQALGSNPFVIVVPCHRVLAARGQAGGFSAPGGTRTKLRLLTIEGVFSQPPDPGDSFPLF